FQAEDGIRDFHVTGVQTCALPIFPSAEVPKFHRNSRRLGQPMEAGVRRKKPVSYGGASKMVQIAQSGHIGVGHAADIARGGMCAWKLPADKSCASVARSLLSMTMTTLGLERDTSDDAVLAVSELATNALTQDRKSTR